MEDCYYIRIPHTVNGEIFLLSAPQSQFLSLRLLSTESSHD